MQQCGIYHNFFLVAKPTFQTMGCVELCSVANILEVLVTPIFRVQFNRVNECPYLFLFYLLVFGTQKFCFQIS